MPTIQSQHAVGRPETPRSVATPAPPAPPSDPRLNTLLKAGPNWSMRPKAPDPTPQEDPSDLDPLLSKANIKQILRHPNSPRSKMLVEKIRSRLTPETIHAMLHGPNGDANAIKLKVIGKHLATDEVDTNLAAVQREMIDEKITRLKSHNIEMLINAFDSDGIEGITQNIIQWRDEKAAMRKEFSESSKSAKSFHEMGRSLSEDNVNKIRRDPGKTYSYNRISESTLDAPSEIRSFSSSDKLDLSGIRNQLNKPLQVVSTFTGASGEIKIDHSQSTNTSVVSVSGNPGEPPMAVKVFGEVRRSNLVT